MLFLSSGFWRHCERICPLLMRPDSWLNSRITGRFGASGPEDAAPRISGALLTLKGVAGVSRGPPQVDQQVAVNGLCIKPWGDMSYKILIECFFAEDEIPKSPLSLASDKGFDTVNLDKSSIGVIGEDRIVPPPGDAGACQDFFDRARPLT